MSSKWFLMPEKANTAKIRFICLPYAGGGAHTYLSWGKELPDNVELIAVQPPGRGTHTSVNPYTDMASLVQGLLTEIVPLLDRPYVILGHSLGSKVAFELLNQLSLHRHRLPDIFIASGSKNPSEKRIAQSIHHLPDAEFIAELARLNGTPRLVLENEELMSLFLPVLRADFEISDKYLYTGTARFPCKLLVLGGKEDVDIPIDSLKHWGQFFSEDMQVNSFDGGHFFIDTQKKAVTSFIRRELCEHYGW